MSPRRASSFCSFLRSGLCAFVFAPLSLRLCLRPSMLPRNAPRNVTFDDAPTYQISFRSCSITQSCIMAFCPSVHFARAASTPEAFHLGCILLYIQSQLLIGSDLRTTRSRSMSVTELYRKSGIHATMQCTCWYQNIEHSMSVSFPSAHAGIRTSNTRCLSRFRA